MSLRILGFILAAILLAGYRLVKPRTQASDLPERWNLATLFLASALTLFAELTLIRWVATEVRVFAYVKKPGAAALFSRLRTGLRSGSSTPPLADRRHRSRRIDRRSPPALARPADHGDASRN